MTTSLTANYPVLCTFQKELQNDPTGFERKSNLYYIASLVSKVVGIVFVFSSFFAYQPIILPFWAALNAPLATQIIGGLFFMLSGKMYANAEKVEKTANYLREIQTTYKKEQNTLLSKWEKILISHGSLAEKKYVEAKKYLDGLIQNASLANSTSFFENLFPNSSSNIEKIISCKHEVLLLKIDLAFKAAVFDAASTNKFNYLMEQEDLFEISKQDPLERNRIQGLNNTFLQDTLIEPLISFKRPFEPFKNFASLSYHKVEQLPPEELSRHIFAVMEELSHRDNESAFIRLI